MVVSDIFYFLFFFFWKLSNLTSIFFKWVVQPPTSVGSGPISGIGGSFLKSTVGGGYMLVVYYSRNPL